jgi:hypothetical protein
MPGNAVSPVLTVEPSPTRPAEPPGDTPSAFGGGGTPAAPRRTRTWWPWIVASAALGTYVAAAIWMLAGMRYEIGDAVSRSSDARIMLFSRDPHLAAVGFVWLPLPVLAQLPLMLVLSPLQHAAYAGPLTTSISGAITALVVARICIQLRLPRWLSIALTVLYAFNPVVVFTSANGMSESWFWTGASIALLGLVRWRRNQRSLDLTIVAIGCAIGMAVRYETISFIPILAVLAAFNIRWPDAAPFEGWRQRIEELRPQLRKFGSVAVTVALPGVFVFAMWLFAEFIIERSPLYWARAQEATGKTTLGPWMPHTLAFLSLLRWTLLHTAGITPGSYLLAIPLLLHRKVRELATGLGLLALCWLFPLLLIVQLIKRVNSGDPRYFEPGVLFVAVAAAWVASELHISRRSLRVAAQGAIAAVLMLGAVSATVVLSNPNMAYIEQVNRFFGGIQGRKLSPITEGEQAPLYQTWIPIQKAVDPLLANGGKIIIDDTDAFPLEVLTHYPGHLLVTADRDYQSTLSDPSGRFNLVLITPGPEEQSLQSIVSGTDPGPWTEVRTFKDPHQHQVVATLYELGPATTTSGGGSGLAPVAGP